MVFISVRNFKLMVSNLKSWFQKLQKSSILKSAALMILWGEEKKGRKSPRFLILKDRGFQAKFVSFFSKNLTMSLFLVREWYIASTKSFILNENSHFIWIYKRKCIHKILALDVKSIATDLQDLQYLTRIP